MPRGSLVMALGLILSVAAGDVSATAQQAPGSNKPKHIAPGSMAPLPPAVIDDELAIGGDDIDARKVSSRMTVEVMVNRTGPYHFLVDSGADTSVVGVKIARALQLKAGAPLVLNGMTATSIVDSAIVDELTLGQSSFHELRVPVLREADLGAQGMLGIDALVNQRLMLDFEKKVIKVEDARQPAQVLDGEIVVIARRHRGQLILTQVTAVKVPIEAVIDTGSEVTIGNLALRDKLIRGNRDKFFTVETTGVTGVTIELEMARIAELKLGGITLRDVPIAFADVPPFKVFGLSKEPALLLGTDLLENFRRVSLDFRARKVRFQLRRCGTSGFYVTTAPMSASMRILSGDNGAVCRR